MGKRLNDRAVIGIHYTVQNGRRFPVIRGGDGPIDETDEFAANLVRMVEQAEGDLASLTPEELTELHTNLTDGYREARGAVETDEQVEALRAVAAAILAVKAEKDGREAAAAADAEAAAQADADRAAALAALDADVEATLAADEDGDEDGSEIGDDDGDDGSDADSEEEDGNEDESDDDTDDGDAEAAARQQASARRTRSSSGAAPLGALRTLQRGQAPAGSQQPAEGALAARIVAGAGVGGDFRAGHVYKDAEELGVALSRLRTDLQVDAPTLRKHVVGRIPINTGGHAVMAKDFAGRPDVDMIEEATKAARKARLERAAELEKAGPTRKVASGGICAPAQPDYSIMVVGDRGTPFVDSLPTVVAERPLSYFPWLEVSMNDAAGSRPGARPDKGIGVVTAAQDAAGYGGTNFAGVTTSIPVGGHAYKDCVKIDCPEPVDSVPEAIFKCVTIGNFQALTFREYVAAFEETTGIYFDIYRDERSIAKVVAAAKKVHGSANTFGTARDVLTKLRRLRAHIVGDRHAPGMTLDVRVPWFAADMIANDLAVSYANGSDNLRITPAQALAILAAEDGIMLGTYDVSAGTTLGGSPTVLPKQAAGDLNDWPAEIRMLVWAEGSVFRSSYGELAFGLRETGMQTNDYSTFEEVFEQTSIRGSDVYTLDLAVCENGAQGAAVAVTCTEPEE
jgi:hypothetical protein